MPTVDVKVSYLEMFAHNGQSVPAPREGLLVLHAGNPPVGYYRYLYNSVGREFHWYTRGRMSDADLAASLSHPRHEIHVLHVDGVPAGFAELDCRTDDVELLQFGLMREFFGKGLGKYFLQWTIDHVWARPTRRFWLHTCTLDHPVALPNYLRAGFVLFKEEMIRREI